MASATRHIPKMDWDHHKDTILSLYQTPGTTLDCLVQIMKDRGFAASISQFETQLYIWESRKNLKKSEWMFVLNQIDSLAARGTRTQLKISGHVVSPSRIKRARKHCKNIASTCPRRVAIEILGQNNEWSTYMSHEHNGNTTPAPSSQTDITSEYILVSNNVCGTSNTVDSTMEEIPIPQSDAAHAVQDVLVSDMNSTLFGMNGDIAVHGSAWMPFQINSPALEPWLPQTSQSSSQLGLATCSDRIYEYSPADLCVGLGSWVSVSGSSLAFQNEVPLHWTALWQKALPSRLLDSALQATDMISTTNVSQISSFSMSLSLHELFEPHNADCRSPTTGTRNMSDAASTAYRMQCILQSLKNACPQLVPYDDSKDINGLISADQMFDSTFIRLLVTSIVNGFAGLEDIPRQSVLRFLGRYGSVNSLLLQFLQINSNPIAKALGENLFKAAIESQDEAVVRTLLDIGVVDANSPVCVVDGRRYTPLERAADLVNLSIVKALVRAKADVNKTYGDMPENSVEVTSPLRHLLLKDAGRLRMYPVAESMIAITEVLLEAGARVHPYLLYQVLIGARFGPLHESLLSKLSPSDHAAHISYGTLAYIAGNFDNYSATTAIEKILRSCEETNCRKCLISHSSVVEWALVRGAKRGNLGLVQLLLPHSSSVTRVLSAAVRSSDTTVINTVLAHNPDLRESAHSIDRLTWSIYSLGDTITTPHAESIKTGNIKLVRFFEENGVLDHLHEGRHFEPAIAAAATIGDAAYVQKLLRHNPNPASREMNYALFCAIQNGHQEITWLLLDAGADIHLERDMFGSADPQTPVSPLFVALEQRNSQLVHKMLNVSIVDYFSHTNHKFRTFFQEALSWGDRSIIENLIFSCPGHRLTPIELNEPLETGNLELLDFLLEVGIGSVANLDYAIEMAVTKSDLEMVQALLQRGANPSNISLIYAVLYDSPKILRLLLERFTERSGISRAARKGFGNMALRIAINKGSSGLDAIDALLASWAVDFCSFGGYGNGEDKFFGSNDPVLVTSLSDLTPTDETPLGFVIRKSRQSSGMDYTAVKKILDAGCDPNAIATKPSALIRDRRIFASQTALLEGIDSKRADLVQLLIERGADVNKPATLGLKRTPLQKAAEVGNLDIVRLLLNEGAKVDAEPAACGGGTALQLAAISGNCNIVGELLEHGADLYAPPSKVQGRWPLEGAAEHGRIDMIGFIWTASCDFGRAVDEEQCRNAMQFAHDNGHIGCRDLIAELSGYHL